MAKTREIRRRIRSIEKTRQITKTMEMIATSKLKRASDRVAASRPYARRLAEVIGRLLDPELRERYPLLRQPAPVRRAAVLLLTSTRGQAGAFHVNLIREAKALMARLRADGVEPELYVVGRKAIAHFRFARIEMAGARTDITDRPTAANAASLVEPLVERFVRGDIDALHIVYAQFRSALSTPPAVMRVLPIEPAQPEKGAAVASYILTPSADVILGQLLPLYVRNMTFRALLETAAAEQGARRTAMKNATDNAGEMLDVLRRQYNRMRQASITQEIAEIVGGAAAQE